MLIDNLLNWQTLTTEIITMASRRKTRKNNKSKPKVEDDEKTLKYNPCSFFSASEIIQIKNVLKLKEVMTLPIAIGCVILNKIDTLETAIEAGVDVNELGPNNTSALIWAIRHKHLELIRLLLEKGADPTIRVDNGENIVITALEHKLWDEITFMEFWQMVSKVSEVEINATNKNGHTILHIAVRREWEKFISILLDAKVEIDITNINGVTPLMTACFRNNFNIVNILINHGADFTKEDNHYRTALCYATVTGAKTSKPPFLISERIIFELKKDLSFKEYIKRRIEIIELILNKEKVSDSESEMLVTLINYLVQYTENGLKLILESKIFELIQKVLTNSHNEDKQKLLLLIALDIVCYNEQDIGFNIQVQLKLIRQFLATTIAVLCLSIIKSKEKYFNLAFYIVLIICTFNDIGQKWMKDNYIQVKQAFKSLPADFATYFQKDFPEERRLKLMKKKMKKLRRFINLLEGIESDTKASLDKNEPLFNIKKSKRRTTVLKAKITKIKNMEITETPSSKNCSQCDSSTGNIKEQTIITNKELAANANTLTNYLQNGKNKEEVGMIVQKKTTKEEIDTKSVISVSSDLEPQDQLSEVKNSLFDIHLPADIEANEEMKENTFMTNDLFGSIYTATDSDTLNPITTSLKQFLQNQQRNSEREEPCFISTFPEWKSKNCKFSLNNWSLFGEKMRIDKRKLKAAMQYLKISLNYENTPNAMILDSALNVVVDYLKELLEIIIARTKAFWGLKQEARNRKNGQLIRQFLYQQRNTNNRSERQAISELQATFHQLITSICSLAYSNLSETLKNIYQLESTLLHFPVNGKTLLPDVCITNNVKIQYPTFSSEAESSLSYVEKVLNGCEDLREDINIPVMNVLPSVLESEPLDLFEKEMSLLSTAKSRDKKKELEGRFKTISGAYHLVSSIENLIKDEKDLKPSTKFPIFAKEDSRKTIDDTKYSEVVKNSRWTERLQQLQDVKLNQSLLGGDVRLCKYPEKNYVVSQGGNFNFVTLGLSSNNYPLAIKKIPSEYCVCKTLKNLINPLLGLRNKHILHYFICDYDENDLILATPLCEYNIGQYVLMLNESSENNIFHLTHMDIVKQVLNGLAFLHQRAEAIVHGNLKPSNIFVDINGVVRLAEFGINRALFKLIAAPKTSLIWFSQETYRKYKIASSMECSLCSDIQVAGMLIYFIVSGGEHPFGTDITTILKNLEKASFALPPARDVKNQILADLVSWMLMYEPNDRPHIKQVLSHVLFWSNERRWHFILNCSGISTNGVPIVVNMTKLHKLIDEAARREQIKGQWVNVARRKFQRVMFQGDDTVAGFLKFIKQIYESHGLINEESMHELKSCVLSYFPAFPLTLFRIMESTGMIKEYPFITYTVAENMVS
ncbi:uncharacterized protein [Euwallacea similis]|uniref:uncharacterized protein n=1 Tax=Euwallacea similis TaxID=1736056 RepID=UPI00344B7AD4